MQLSKQLEERYTWTPTVCRILAFDRFWAIILPTLGGGEGVGSSLRGVVLKGSLQFTAVESTSSGRGFGREAGI